MSTGWIRTGAEPSITCSTCCCTSYHPQDVARGYCGACHAFHDRTVEAAPGWSPPDRRPRRPWRPSVWHAAVITIALGVWGASYAELAELHLAAGVGFLVATMIGVAAALERLQRWMDQGR